MDIKKSNLDSKKSLGLNIRRYRKNNNMLQRDLAERLGVSGNYISLIESGNKYPSLKAIFQIAEILDVPPAALLEKDPLLDELVLLSKKYNLEQIMSGIEKLAKNNHSTSIC
jgi:transcriptional regulator with XRE-family HTH domain